MKCTAYYSPSPRQGHYARGSYRRDVRMNGAGKETWYGSKPAKGTIAADSKHYRHGTSLMVPGYGLGIVEDKGSAIKGRKHIDLYMGKGEEGLKKAEEWDQDQNKLDIVVMRVVKVEVR